MFAVIIAVKRQYLELAKNDAKRRNAMKINELNAEL
jgi:hypothetical protein